MKQGTRSVSMKAGDVTSNGSEVKHVWLYGMTAYMIALHPSECWVLAVERRSDVSDEPFWDEIHLDHFPPCLFDEIARLAKGD